MIWVEDIISGRKQESEVQRACGRGTVSSLMDVMGTKGAADTRGCQGTA